jgi:hypothetical protein
VLVRCGKGGKRRTVGMDDWAWEHVVRWTQHRVKLPVVALLSALSSYIRRATVPGERAERGRSVKA